MFIFRKVPIFRACKNAKIALQHPLFLVFLPHPEPPLRLKKETLRFHGKWKVSLDTLNFSHSLRGFFFSLILSEKRCIRVETGRFDRFMSSRAPWKKETESKTHHFTTKLCTCRCRLSWVASQNGFRWTCIPWCRMHDLHFIDFICSNRASQFRSVTSSSFIKDAHPHIITVVKDLLSTDRRHSKDFPPKQEFEINSFWTLANRYNRRYFIKCVPPKQERKSFIYPIRKHFGEHVTRKKQVQGSGWPLFLRRSWEKALARSFVVEKILNLFFWPPQAFKVVPYFSFYGCPIVRETWPHSPYSGTLHRVALPRWR